MKKLLMMLGVVLLTASAYAADQTPYAKLVGETFVADMDGQTVTVRVVFDGVGDSNLSTIYKNSKIKTKDQVFLLHHDPAGQAAASAFGGAGMPPFAISVAKADADAILALKPGTLLEVTGPATKTVFGFGPVKTKGLHIAASTYAAVADEAPAAVAPAPEEAAAPSP